VVIFSKSQAPRLAHLAKSTNPSAKPNDKEGRVKPQAFFFYGPA